MQPTTQEKVEFIRARWHSLCDTFCITEQEAEGWAAEFPMRYILHGIRVALTERKRNAARGCGLMEDESILRAEQVMREEMDAYELRRSQN